MVRGVRSAGRPRRRRHPRQPLDVNTRVKLVAPRDLANANDSPFRELAEGLRVRDAEQPLRCRSFDPIGSGHHRFSPPKTNVLRSTLLSRFFVLSDLQTPGPYRDARSRGRAIGSPPDPLAAVYKNYRGSGGGGDSHQGQQPGRDRWRSSTSGWFPPWGKSRVRPS
jgi:hypothetical protein